MQKKSVRPCLLCLLAMAMVSAPLGALALAEPEAAVPAAPVSPAAEVPAAPVAPASAEVPAAAPDEVIARVREQLATATKPAARDQRADIAAFYTERTGPALWVTKDSLTPRAQTVIAELRKAAEWGLDAAAFDVPVLDGATPPVDAVAEAEIKLSLAVVKYANHARGGRVSPSSLSRTWDQQPPILETKTVLAAIGEASDPAQYLTSLHPKHPQFERLRKLLLAARKPAETPVAAPVIVPAGPRLEPGMTHAHVALLRQRLNVAVPSGGQPDVYDESLAVAVKAFQKERGQKANGIVAKAARDALNGAAALKDDRNAERILINMERWRWMPETLGDFYVWDNIPEFMTRVVKKEAVIHSEKIIVGKLETPTPVFSDEMEFVIFHPEWGVPDSIKIKEILPYLQPSNDFFGFGATDTRVLQRHNLRVNYNGRPVDPSQVNWSSVDIRRFSFIQPPGAQNVLGVVKFRFPNRHDVYMHDTPQRELFANGRRAFSHGCIRVNNPRRLAEILLAEDKGWSSEEVGRLLAGGQNKEVTLDNKFPVHITYFTMLVEDDGKVSSFADLYGHDSRLASALAGKPVRFEQLADGDAVQEPRRRKQAGKKQSGDSVLDLIMSGLGAN